MRILVTSLISIGMIALIALVIMCLYWMLTSIKMFMTIMLSGIVLFLILGLLWAIISESYKLAGDIINKNKN